MLQAIDIRKKYGDNEILKGVTVRVDKGEVVAVIGRSGSGKSTLLRCLNHLETIDSGEIRIDGQAMVTTGADGAAQMARAMQRLRAETPADFGGGKLTVRCRYGTIEADKENATYYKGNMASSGLEIRINGRCIERGLYSKVFGRALHPSCNRFLAQIDLRGEDSTAFPATETTKNAFVEGDARTQALFRWIRANVRQPETSRESLESRLVGKLAEKKAVESDTLRIGREEGTYRTIGLQGKIDLLVSKTGGMTIYEAKAKGTKAEDLYQLRLYADGCAMDGVPAKESVLIGARHPKEVCSLTEQLNSQCDPTGAPYHFVLRTWAEEGISA